MTDEPLLKISGLETRFFTEEGQVNAVESVDLEIADGEVFGIVGESGSGKSVTALSLLGMVESPGRVTAGEIWYRNADLAAGIAGDVPDAVDGDYVNLQKLPDRVRRTLRGTHFSMVFQDPMSSFNPSLTVGEQIAEAVEAQQRARANPRSVASRTQGYGLGKYLMSFVSSSRKYVTQESRERAVELLEMVGIPDPVLRAEEHPHEYSGGMLQRAMVAQALAGEPDVLIADEPTTALDVTIQAQVLDLLSRIQSETGMTILLITHNLGVVARMCDRVGVMYAGEVVERGTLADVFDSPVHPYTQGLLGSVPEIEGASGRLQPIAGNVPSLLDHEMPDRCYFAERCPKAMEACLTKPAELDVPDQPGHSAACYLATEPFDEATALPADYFDDPGTAARATGVSEDGVPAGDGGELND
ncbi:ABC transporter ATP-binding protein [Halorubrum vacuolatum]|uniref:Nickel import system ATP-binding protein NikD n=1 Tax=Halorubrum vacuolatum TaxID=63740 RepID=A0A238UNS3_HALVU|nr:ABC transporter ATP-binding protein [Halorubrum vacuolatum]SNR23257.1 peptide/nickel transport system ATP-binding protein [Halorubrum vacuolatum]